MEVSQVIVSNICIVTIVDEGGGGGDDYYADMLKEQELAISK